MKPWIVNASPLILLGKINRLELLAALPPSFSIPHAVSLEILSGPAHCSFWCGRLFFCFVTALRIPPVSNLDA